MKNKKFDITRSLFFISLFIIPLLCSFFVVIINNYEKFDSVFKTFIVLLIAIFSITFTITFIQMAKDHRIFNRKHMVLKIGVFLL